MSRRQPIDNSASVSLFPFLAVLLCTMGALLVVLVAVSRTAKANALKRVAEQQPVAAVEEEPETKAELEKVDVYVDKLQKLRTEAEAKMREDQLRLGQLESHMRNLRDELEKLVRAANELEALEDEHYDDRTQAEREIERLNKLIEENQIAIDELKQSGTKKRAYAVLPYEGPNGTYRRPIYVECCKEGVVLQPEGVVISRDDLQPPIGSGNALAAALRAAREHYVQKNPQEGQSRDEEPYPMVLIRPEGALLFGAVRRAIEAGDFDFGFEPVEDNWDLKFGTPDPMLANAEQQAIEQARARQVLLAAAAPRAYRNREMASSGEFEFRDDRDPGMPRGFGPKPRIESQPAIEFPGTSFSSSGESTDDSTSPAGPAPGNPGDISANSQQSETESTSATSTPTFSRDEGAAAGGPRSATPTNNSTPSAASSAPSNIADSAPTGSAGEPSSQSAPSDAGTSVSNMASSSDSDQTPPVRDFDPHKLAAANFKEKRKNERAVAVRRMIRIVVRDSQLGIVTDESRNANGTIAGKTIQFQGDTVQSMDEFVKAVQSQVESWGIAGDGLYWRPVLELHIGPDGQRRAEDLQRLLKNSDIEVIVPSATANSHQGADRATR